MRRKEEELEMSKRQKKMTQEQLEEFLQRHQEYLQQKIHKEEIMRAVSSQYDLSSGRKLFEPKINETSETLLNCGSVKKFIESPSYKKSELLQEESGQNIRQGSKQILNREKSRSGKSRGEKSKKSRSSSKKEKQVRSKKRLFEKVKESEKKDGNFKALPYQMTKIKGGNS
jgi:hypothetical protein